jgi:hypothetical protein
MKNALRTGLAICGLVVTLMISAGAQSVAKANIPFGFTMGDKTMEPGEYMISISDSGSVPEILVLRDANGRGLALWSGNRIEPAERNGKSVLVFNKYGDEYFLSEIRLSAGLTTNVHKCRRERELKRELAMHRRTSQEVTVALAK